VAAPTKVIALINPIVLSTAAKVIQED
jgi:hypothetical protein